jgi:hypothetical protein
MTLENTRKLFGEHFSRLFAIDLRSLAVFRIGMGMLLLYDCLSRARFLNSLYTDQGLMPIRSVGPLSVPDTIFFIHGWFGSVEYAALLFVVMGLAAICLMLGLFTPVAAAVCWLLVNSLRMRIPNVDNGGDILCRVLLFWSIFLPLGACWSLDARRRISSGVTHVVNIASAALLLTPALMYFESAFFKNGVTWFNGDAVSIALQEAYWSRPLADVLVGYPTLCRALTFITLGLEFICPFLLFSPFATRACRLTAMALLTSVQVGFAFTIEVGLFPFFSTLALVPFIPSKFWGIAKVIPFSRSFWKVPIPFYVVLFPFLLWTLCCFVPIPFPPFLTSSLRATGFATGWAMYAPDPHIWNSSYTLAFRKADGTESPIHDVLNDSVVRTYEKMKHDKRSKGFLGTIMFKKPIRFQFAEWLCRGRKEPLDQTTVLVKLTRWRFDRKEQAKEIVHLYDCPTEKIAFQHANGDVTFGH